MTKRNPHRLPGDMPLPFAEPEPRGARMTKHAPKPTGKYARTLDPSTDPAAAPRRNKPGPTANPDALHTQLADGRGAHLHAVIPADLHRRLRVRAAMTDLTLSEMTAEALTVYLGDADA